MSKLTIRLNHTSRCSARTNLLGLGSGHLLLAGLLSVDVLENMGNLGKLRMRIWDTLFFQLLIFLQRQDISTYVLIVRVKQFQEEIAVKLEVTHIVGILKGFLAEGLRHTRRRPRLRVASHCIHGSEQAPKRAS